MLGIKMVSNSWKTDFTWNIQWKQEETRRQVTSTGNKGEKSMKKSVKWTKGKIGNYSGKKRNSQHQKVLVRCIWYIRP